MKQKRHSSILPFLPSCMFVYTGSVSLSVFLVSLAVTVCAVWLVALCGVCGWCQRKLVSLNTPKYTKDQKQIFCSFQSHLSLHALIIILKNIKNNVQNVLLQIHATSQTPTWVNIQLSKTNYGVHLCSNATWVVAHWVGACFLPLIYSPGIHPRGPKKKNLGGRSKVAENAGVSL